MLATLTGQTVFIPRKMMYFSRNISRFYHSRQKLCCVNNFLLKKHSLFSFLGNTWSISRTCYSTGSKINFPESLTKEKAKEVVSKFTLEERDLFSKVLAECKSEEDRVGYQGNYFFYRLTLDCGYLCKFIFL